MNRGLEHDPAATVTASNALNDTEANSPEESVHLAVEDLPAPSEPENTVGEVADAPDLKAHAALKSLPDKGGGSPMMLGILLIGAGVLMCCVISACRSWRGWTISVKAPSG